MWGGGVGGGGGGGGGRLTVNVFLICYSANPFWGHPSTLAPRRGRRVPAITVPDLGSANNLLLISNTAEPPLQHPLAVKKEFLGVGLQPNSKTAEVLAFSTDGKEVCTSSGESLNV